MLPALQPPEAAHLNAAPFFAPSFELTLDFSPPRLDPCDLQLGDSWGGAPGKMSVVAPVKKIRKKSDSKPQSQINKCNNEKRRRELENDTINQLEELLVACLTDVRQPDKNGIVQEAAAQIRRKLERRRLDESDSCTSTCTSACLPAAPLQHGDVSSTLPLHRSEITFLIEAFRSYTDLFGWVLLGINCDGDIECVTENIKELVKWERTDLHKKNIFDYLHHGDHQKFEPVLQNMSLGWSRSDSPPGRRHRGIRSRLLVKPGENGEGVNRYEDVVISATLMREGEHGAYALCVIRREEDLSAATPQIEGASPRPLHITFRLDLQGKILSCEGRNSVERNSLIVGKRLQDLVHQSDAAKFAEHLRAAASTTGALSGPPTRLRLSPAHSYHHTRPQSRIFHANPATNEPDFIMSTFTMLTENELNMLESGSTSSVPPVGGPLMTSAIVNGNGPRNGQFPPSPTEPSFSFGSSDFDMDYFPQNNWNDNRGSSPATYTSFPFSPLLMEDTRPQEERTVNSVSGSGPPTPRTPHTPAPNTPATPLPPAPASTPPTLEPESAKLRNLLSKRESPISTPGSVPEHPNTTPATPVTPISTSLLTPTPTPTTSSGNNLILKGLLNQEDEEESQRTVSTVVEGPPPPTPPPQQRLQGNNMLLRLLNDKSDEEDPDQRSMRNSELLSQLLKREEGNNNNNNNTIDTPNATPVTPVTSTPTLSLGTTESTTSSSEELLQLLVTGGQRSALKRKLMQDEQNLKRPHSIEPQQVSSSGTNGTTGTLLQCGGAQQNQSKLWEKNKMLASLLARTPSAPTTPFPLPNTNLQRNFPKPPTSNLRYPSPRNSFNNVLNNNKAGGTGFEINNSGNNNGVSGNIGLSPLQQMLQGANRPNPAPSQPGEFRTGNNMYMGEGNSDPLLSVILDEVIEFAPDNAYCPDNTGIIDIITSIDSQPGQQSPINHHHNTYQVMNEKMAAINAIQQSLMRCESSVKSPSSPGVPPAYPNSTQAPGGPWVGRYAAQGQHSTISHQQQPQQQPTSQQQQQQQPQQQQQQQHQQQAHRQKAQLAHHQAQQKARLLQAQQQQMVVGAAGGGSGTSGPLHGNMDALLNAPTPPNVSLQRATDAPPYQPPPHYHHHHHAGNGNVAFSAPPGAGNGQDSPAYKLSLQQQQNPMLNAQLTQSGYGGQRGSPLAPHTPLTPHAPHSPYLQQPPPRLQRHMSHPTPPLQVGSGVGGFYGGGVADSGYCVEQPPLYPRAHHPHQPHQPHHHSNHMSGMTSEYVRQELRAVVGARTGASGVGGGGGGGARPPDHLPPPPPDLESLGLSFEMPPTGGVVGGGGSAQTAPSNAQKLWETHQNTTSTMEEVRGGDQKSSLLQKLLSE